jgi:DNA-binding protein H-NS
VVEQSSLLRAETVASTTRVVDSVRALENMAHQISTSLPALHETTLQALSGQTQKISRVVEAVESQDRSTTTYNQALLDSLQSHQNAVSQSTDSLRALVAKLIDRENAK